MPNTEFSSENDTARRPEAAAEPAADALTGEQRSAITALVDSIQPVSGELGDRFSAHDQQLAVVGGPVRDALLGRVSSDVDLTTDAVPQRILEIVDGWADSVWTVGIEFGTVGLRKRGLQLEITTYRSESYSPKSRKPDVNYGTDIHGDLLRRDFTVNAMAVRLPGQEFVDPFGGLADLRAGVLRTPGRPEDSFSDDPLRIMRAVRFAAQLGFTLAPEVAEAARNMADRLTIVSAERVKDELVKLMLSPNPRRGIELMVDLGIARHVLPEVPKMQLEIDEHHRHKDVYEHSLTVLDQAIDLEKRRGHAPDLVLRLAALLHDIGKPKTRAFESGNRVTFHHHEVVGASMSRKRLTALRFPKDVVSDVSTLVGLHLRFHGYGKGEWTDSAVRRYARDAGDQLERLHILTRADCTTRNRRKAAALSRSYDDIERRIDKLAEQEELDKIRPDLDGNEIQEILGVKPGPVVGRAYRFLLELRLENGPMSKEDATSELRAWAAEHLDRDS
ncbi:CCA tRNA nucleotidyltransferase [Nocardiopsis sp. EMB25]|uniref:CCA tRNA nucleotidyltransferase n=1 Tax=Nocardiopsis TaxID=2013 RepID=UPI00034614E0|nr:MULTISPECIES: CCA tRNA nucleotidyltransferase [Nocardiopsis]MCY9786643.1 CCA tRNA nucleotidyltransferase [Nocardiopsis sp. EMB25]